MSADADRIARRFSIVGLTIYLGLALATCAAYFPVTGLDFVGLDDPSYITGNPHLREGFTWTGLKWAFTSYDPDNWFPLTRLSHMLDYALFGLRAPWHHGENVLIHVLASLLLYSFLYRGTRERWPSAFVAAVFALHPVHVESVVWISERKDVLCAFFWFAALWAWVRYTERPSKASYVLTLSLLAAGVMSKPMIVTFPLLLPLLGLWPLRRSVSRRRLILEEAPFVAVAAAGAILTLLAQSAFGAVRSLKSIAFGERVENALITVFIYIGKTFWPTNLANPYHSEREPVWLAALAGLGIAGISVLVVAMRRNRPYLVTGWFWFLITLLPVIGLVQVGGQARADRYMYVPMVGLLIVVAWGAADILKGFGAHRWAVPAAAAAAGAACLTLACVTRNQQQYWVDSPTLFRHAIAIDSQNYLAWEYLGASTDWEKELSGRIECFRIATQIRPDLPEPHGSLGRALLKAGLVDESIAELETSLRINPLDTRARCNLGTAFLRANRVDDAVSQFRTALRNDPDSPMALNNLAVGLWQVPGSSAEAKKQLERAISLKPDDPLTHDNLGLVLLETPQGVTDAQQQFIQALALRPGDIAAHLGLSRALATAPFSDLAAAEAHLNSARQLEPDPALRTQFETLRIDYGEIR